VLSGCGPVFQDQSVHTLPDGRRPFASESVDTGCSRCFPEDPFGVSELRTERSSSPPVSTCVPVAMGQSCLSAVLL
jgi:hypothetical protein